VKTDVNVLVEKMCKVGEVVYVNMLKKSISLKWRKLC